MSTAQITWLLWLFISYLVTPVIFIARHRHSPYAYHLRRWNTVQTLDMCLAGAIALYSTGLFVSPPRNPISTTLGITLHICGLCGTLWAISHLGPHWRLGHDDNDASTTIVTTGPYRLVNHPIYLCMGLSFVAQTILDGAHWSAIALVVVLIVFWIIQGRAERARWSHRTHQPN